MPDFGWKPGPPPGAERGEVAWYWLDDDGSRGPFVFGLTACVPSPARGRHARVATPEEATKMEAARDVLRALEWGRGPFAGECPWCQRGEGDEHTYDCKLAEAIGAPRQKVGG